MGVHAAATRDTRAHPIAAEAAIPRIGPNAVLQTLAALEALEGRPVAEAVARDAAMPATWPDGLIPEAWFLRVLRATRARLTSSAAERVLRDAGARTADYVAANRIPGPVRSILRVLPARLAVPFLLKAFERHAWTFAGRGTFAVEGGYPGVIRLDDCPTCRDPIAAEHGGAYYEAAFAGLMRLAAPRVSITEIECRVRGAAACRFRIDVGASAPAAGESSCASS